MIMVRVIGLEPTRPKAPEPKSGASTNFATPAHEIRYSTIMKIKITEFFQSCLLSNKLTPHLLHTPRTYYVSTPTVPCVGGVTSTVKQTVKQIVPIDMNTEIPKLLLLLYFSC